MSPDPGLDGMEERALDARLKYDALLEPYRAELARTKYVARLERVRVAARAILGPHHTNRAWDELRAAVAESDSNDGEQFQEVEPNGA